jgi:hypothetical protein
MIETLSVEKMKEERTFSEFRGKVRMSELLSASVLKLLWALRFSGKVTIILENGRILKSGYEEAYFRRLEPSISSTIQ